MGVCPGQRLEPGLRGGRASWGWSPCWASVSPSVRAGGDGVTGPKAGRSLGTHLLCSSCPGVGAVSICLWVRWVLPCAPPERGLKWGPGVGVLRSQPTRAEPGSRRGRDSGAARGPEPGSSVGSRAAHTCPAGLPLPEEGAVCQRGSRGLGMSPRGEGLGLPPAGTRRRGCSGLTSCPHAPRILRPLWPGGPHPGLETKIPLDSSPGASGLAGCRCPSAEGHVLREAGGTAQGPPQPMVGVGLPTWSTAGPLLPSHLAPSGPDSLTDSSHRDPLWPVGVQERRGPQCDLHLGGQ